MERTSVAELDALIGQEFPILDHGFIRLVDYMGSDQAIVQAARVSYGVGTKKDRDDRGLIRYLMKNKHTTPFEMCEIKFHCKLPIFVARQWIRHRTANVNEYSARYSILEKEFFLPDPEEMRIQSKSNKQGRGEKLSDKEIQHGLALIEKGSENAYDAYEDLLAGGLSRELARMVLPLNYYTQWYWKIDLHNLLHFLKLRMDPHAQSEIRAYADRIACFLMTWVPISYEAFRDFQLENVELSKAQIEVIRDLLNHLGDIDFERFSDRLSTGEIQTLKKYLNGVT